MLQFVLRLVLRMGAVPATSRGAASLLLALAPVAPGAALAQAGGFEEFVRSYQIEGSIGVAISFAVDFDGDGDLDLIEVYGAPERIRTFFNDGRGTLHLAAETALPDAAFVVATADANADGIPDLAWAETVGSGSFPVRIYQGESDGSFAIAQELPKTNDVGALTFAHVDTDSALDLIVARRAGSIDLYSGSGGSFHRIGRARQSERGIASLVAGDFDADGDTDLITGTRSGALFFYAQGARGRFSDGTRIATPPAPQLREILAVDLNGDPFPDLIVSTAESTVCPDSVYHGNGDARFTQVQTLCNDGFADGTADLDAADVDGDGHLDVVALRGGDLYYPGRSDGTFDAGRPVFTPPLFFAQQLVLGDLDRDELGDALVRDGRCCNTPTHVYLGEAAP